jgi:hypothetical protein
MVFMMGLKSLRPLESLQQLESLRPPALLLPHWSLYVA